MGDGFETICSGCNDERTYTLGVGMDFGSLEGVLGQFPKGIREKIRHIQSNFKIQDAQFSNELFECRRCDTAHERLALKLTYGDNKIFEPKYRCGECHRNLDPAQKALTLYRCRRCKQKLLTENFSFSWD